MTANSQYQQGVAANKYYQSQAEQARVEGEYAIKAGERQANLIQDSAKEQGKQLKTSQAEQNASTRAALAASGVQGVTSADIISNNLSKQDLDVEAVRYNADMRSYNAREEAKLTRWEKRLMADNLDYSGKMAKKAGKTQAFSSLLSTAASTGKLFI